MFKFVLLMESVHEFQFVATKIPLVEKVPLFLYGILHAIIWLISEI